MSDHRAESRSRWSATAAAWAADADALQRAAMPVSTWMVEAIAPQPGQTLLELAAGPGDTGFLAAELIRPGGTLICTDFVPEMLSAAQRRAEALNLDNVRFKQVDADLPLDIEAASIDAVLCRWAYMLLADPEAALRETRRVLRPGGRVALAAWTGAEDNTWSALLSRVVVDRGLLEPPDPTAPGQFTWAPEGAIAEHLEAAGFVEYEVDTVAFTQTFASVADWWEAQSRRSPRISEVAATMDAGTRDAVLADLARLAERWIDADGAVAIPARTWVAAATA